MIKRCREYKNKNWVEILDLINIREAIFDGKKCKKWGYIRVKIE